MNTLAWLGLVVGCLVVLVAIAGAVVTIWYRPTVEYAYQEGRGGQPESVTGWRRAVVLAIGAPVFAVVLLFRAVLRRPDR